MKYDEFAHEILRLYPEYRYMACDKNIGVFLYRAKPTLAPTRWLPDPTNDLMCGRDLPEGLTDIPDWTKSLRPEVPEVHTYPITSDGEVWRCREYNIVQIQGLVGFAGFQSPNGVVYNTLYKILCDYDLPVDFTGWEVLFK